MSITQMRWKHTSVRLGVLFTLILFGCRSDDIRQAPSATPLAPSRNTEERPTSSVASSGSRSSPVSPTESSTLRPTDTVRVPSATALSSSQEFEGSPTPPDLNASPQTQVSATSEPNIQQSTVIRDLPPSLALGEGGGGADGILCAEIDGPRWAISVLDGGLQITVGHDEHTGNRLLSIWAVQCNGVPDYSARFRLYRPQFDPIDLGLADATTPDGYPEFRYDFPYFAFPDSGMYRFTIESTEEIFEVTFMVELVDGPQIHLIRTNDFTQPSDFEPGDRIQLDALGFPPSQSLIIALYGPESESRPDGQGFNIFLNRTWSITADSLGNFSLPLPSEELTTGAYYIATCSPTQCISIQEESDFPIDNATIRQFGIFPH